MTTSRYDIDYSTRGAFADFTAAFAGVLLIITSAMDVLQGAAAVSNGDLYAAGSDYLYKFNMTTWGWIYIVLGVIGVAVGIGILRRASWGQVLGMIVAGLAMLANFAGLPHYPFWSMILIAFNGAVIWALALQLRNYDLTPPRPSTPAGVVPDHPVADHDVTRPPST